MKTLIGSDEESRIQFSEEFHGDGAAFFKACADNGLEGIVSKHALAPYRFGRSKTWLKTKCFTESTFVVVGTDRDRKTGALRGLLAQPDSAGLNYAGAAFIALDDDARTEFLAEVGRLTTPWAAFKSSRLTGVKMVRTEPDSANETSGGKQDAAPRHGESLGTIEWLYIRQFAFQIRLSFRYGLVR